MKKDRENRVLILSSVFNDWDSLALLLKKLDASLTGKFSDLTFEVMAIDDGSTKFDPGFLSQVSLLRIAKVEVLHLRSNLGHQRALAIGLAYLQDKNHRAIVVMDADGEDDPDDVPRLVEAMLSNHEEKIVFAERTLRSERLLFRVFYRLYQLLHYGLTGRSIRVGNFSIIPAKRLAPLGVLSDMWNHYAATVFKSRLPFTSIRAKRAKRLLGDSTMSFFSLVIHGLSALSVHGELIGTRLLAATVASGGLAFLLGLAWIGSLWLGERFIPVHYYRWGLIGALLIAQCLGLSLFFAFIMLKSRASSGFLPIRDFGWFVGSVETVPLKHSKKAKAA